MIILSEDFQRFFDRSSRLVERALCEMSEANLFVDYTGAYADDDSEGLDGEKSGQKQTLTLGSDYVRSQSFIDHSRPLFFVFKLQYIL